jgi:hypothetical protein
MLNFRSTDPAPLQRTLFEPGALTDRIHRIKKNGVVTVVNTRKEGNGVVAETGIAGAGLATEVIEIGIVKEIETETDVVIAIETDIVAREVGIRGI